MMHRNIWSALGIGTAIAVAGPTIAQAQVCAGYAAHPGAFSAGASLATPPGGTSLGIEGSYNYRNPLAAFASFNLVRPETDGRDESILGAGVSYELTDFVPIVPAWLSVCPVAAVSLGSVGGTSTFTVPLGVGFGTTIPLVPGALEVMPFAVPQFVMTRVSVDDVSVTDHNFGIGFGALARLANVYAGVTAGKEFVEASDIDLAFRAGVTIPVR